MICKTPFVLWRHFIPSTYNEIINSQLESTQYNASLAITGAIKKTSKSNVCKELGRESLKSQMTHRRLHFTK